ncbi:hypothetical protein VW23_000995 [Devosia insulae DS-56]|uniref:Uncharacterized protein n=1 Tax=Devosia insulae DS-56 TaxID=1116389 RepID=A0A1E5XTH3_9HYPH|nr:hypothetical protein VW23_000995 [Devosia insulae DS-56]
MMRLPSRVSMASAVAFIATSTPAMPEPKKNRAMAKLGRSQASPGRTDVSASQAKVRRIAARSDSREVTKVPTSGSDAMMPSGSAASASPSSPTSSPRRTWISGRCGSHLAMISPSRKKISRMAAIGDTANLIY